MLLGPGMNQVMQRANSPEIKRSQLSYYNSRVLISSVKVRNIKSASCAGLTQLERKLLQHSYDMLVDNNILLQKIKQDHLYFLFLMGDTNVLVEIDHDVKLRETSFLNKLVCQFCCIVNAKEPCF